MSEWTQIEPAVDATSEFIEIANDFGNPLEIVREAISNSLDARATEIWISFTVDQIDGAPTCVITITDNGDGMKEEELINGFWGLGFSSSRNDVTKIGEKGHGTKIYLKSERVTVRTQNPEYAIESECDRPMRSLAQGGLHKPSVRRVAPYRAGTGSTITVFGYNNNERSHFYQDFVRDYILWFTKFGSFEREFGIEVLAKTILKLKCLDKDDFETVAFGHLFPPIDDDIQALMDKFHTDAADHYVKRYRFVGRLPEMPEVTYETVIYVEGDEVKRKYNPMIRDRSRQDTGRYKVGDRYGIWLSKDFIPVQRVNEWISGFGSGSNAYTLLHGFVNCQRLRLTANRGSAANSAPDLIDALKVQTKKHLDEVDADIKHSGIYTLFQWKAEELTLSQEKKDYESRVKALKKRGTASYRDLELIEPSNEAELFFLLATMIALDPKLLPLAPLDYSTSRGVDLIAKNISDNRISESELWYVELKYVLRSPLNHGFKYLRWIVCWDFGGGIGDGFEFDAVEGGDRRTLRREEDDGFTHYFLAKKGNALRIQVIRLKEFLKERLGIEFSAP